MITLLNWPRADFPIAHHWMQEYHKFFVRVVQYRLISFSEAKKLQRVELKIPHELIDIVMPFNLLSCSIRCEVWQVDDKAIKPFIISLTNAPENFGSFSLLVLCCHLKIVSTK